LFVAGFTAVSVPARGCPAGREKLGPNCELMIDAGT
jgi:hypothetical protein